MNPVHHETVNKCKFNFLKLSSKRQLDIHDKALLVSDITQLLGLYTLSYDIQLHHLLHDMVNFGEQNNLVLAGQRLRFDELNRKYKMPIDYKQIRWEPSFLK